MSNVEYLPKHHQRYSLRELPSAAKKTLKGFLDTFIHLLSIQKKPLPAAKDLPYDDKCPPSLDSEQAKLCKDIFDQTQKRADKIQGKAEKYSGFIPVVLSLALGTLSIVIREPGLPNSYRSVCIWVACLGCTALLLAFFGCLRCLRVQTVDEPYVGAVIDTDKHEVRKFDSAFIPFSYLSCALRNGAQIDEMADYLRATEFLFFIGVVTIIVGSLPLLFLIKPSEPKTPQVAIQNVEEIKAAISEGFTANLALLNSLDARMRLLEAHKTLAPARPHKKTPAPHACDCSRESK